MKEMIKIFNCKQLDTICSIFAFSDSSMEWDSSRVSAAIPSGIGFLGSGLSSSEASAALATAETSVETLKNQLELAETNAKDAMRRVCGNDH